MTEPTPRYSWYVLGALFVVYIFNFLDRQILSMLIEPIKEELDVSDTYMGLLTGPAFAAFYLTAGFPLARLADKWSRTNLITIGMVVWSAMTAASGLARNFTQLALARIGVGVGEASFTPASHSLIADYFPPEKRATALAIFAAGAGFGQILGNLTGGYVGEYVGWREAFYIVGLPGIFIAFAFKATVREPLRGASEKRRAESQGESEGESVWEVIRYLSGRPSFVFLAISASLHGFSSYGAGTWTAVFLMRVHDLSLSQAGLVLAVVAGSLGFVGQILGGRLSDRFGARDVRWYMWFPAATSALALPFLVAFYLIPNFPLALALSVPGSLMVSMWTGPTYAMAQGLAPPHMRAMASAIVVFLLNIVGMGLGPLFVGWLNDTLAPRFGEMAVRYSLLAAVIPHTLASIFNLLAARTLKSDLEMASR